MTDNGHTLFTLNGSGEHETTFKRSRFIARAVGLNSVDCADDVIAALSLTDASHNCWAWRFGENYRFDDDGEPAGSAGKPILMAIDGQRIDRVAVVVARYFGGIKLGVGGLMRAYGGCAAECLRQTPSAPVIEMVAVQVRIDFSANNDLHQLIARLHAAKLSERFEANGLVSRLEVPVHSLDEFCELLTDLTSGSAEIAVGNQGD